MKKIPIEALREQLSYNPKTGLFRWRVAKRGLKAGAPAGGVSSNGEFAVLNEVA